MYEEKLLSENLTDFEAALQAHGLATATVLYNINCCMMLFRLHEVSGKNYLDGKIVVEHTESIRRRYDESLISQGYYRHSIRVIEQFVELCTTGKISRENQSRGSTYALTPEFEHI